MSQSKFGFQLSELLHPTKIFDNKNCVYSDLNEMPDKTFPNPLSVVNDTNILCEATPFCAFGIDRVKFQIYIYDIYDIYMYVKK